MADEKVFGVNHDVHLYNKNKLNISGVCSVESFDENQISAVIKNGEYLTIEGSGIEITDFNTEKQILEAKGTFVSFFYDERKDITKKSVFSKIFGIR